MPISNTSVNYSGRLKDVHIMQGVDPTGTAAISLSFGKISNYCTGIQKLIQRYTICLLTNLSSQQNFPNFGSSLLSTLSTTPRKLNKIDLFHVFNLANAKVITEFRDYQRQNTGIPTDEQLDTAILLSSNILGDQVQLTIQLYPVAQPSVEFIVPLPKS